eukprot:3553222-Rhodomonas_salina.3
MACIVRPGVRHPHRAGDQSLHHAQGTHSGICCALPSTDTFVCYQSCRTITLKGTVLRACPMCGTNLAYPTVLRVWMRGTDLAYNEDAFALGRGTDL